MSSLMGLSSVFGMDNPRKNPLNTTSTDDDDCWNFDNAIPLKQPDSYPISAFLCGQNNEIVIQIGEQPLLKLPQPQQNLLYNHIIKPELDDTITIGQSLIKLRRDDPTVINLARCLKPIKEYNESIATPHKDYHSISKFAYVLSNGPSIELKKDLWLIPTEEEQNLLYKHINNTELSDTIKIQQHKIKLTRNNPVLIKLAECLRPTNLTILNYELDKELKIRTGIDSWLTLTKEETKLLHEHIKNKEINNTITIREQKIEIDRNNKTIISLAQTLDAIHSIHPTQNLITETTQTFQSTGRKKIFAFFAGMIASIPLMYTISKMDIWNADLAPLMEKRFEQFTNYVLNISERMKTFSFSRN